MQTLRPSILEKQVRKEPVCQTWTRQPVGRPLLLLGKLNNRLSRWILGGCKRIIHRWWLGYIALGQQLITL